MGSAMEPQIHVAGVRRDVAHEPLERIRGDAHHDLLSQLGTSFTDGAPQGRDDFPQWETDVRDELINGRASGRDRAHRRVHK